MDPRIEYGTFPSANVPAIGKHEETDELSKYYDKFRLMISENFLKIKENCRFSLGLGKFCQIFANSVKIWVFCSKMKESCGILMKNGWFQRILT